MIKAEGIKNYPKELVSPPAVDSRLKLIMLLRKNSARLVHVQTSIRPDNSSRIIFTEISGDGKIVFEKVHETVENTLSGATNKVFSENEILKRNLTSEEYVNVIKKCIPGTDVVGPITNTLTTEKKQEDKKAKLKELFNSARKKGIESYDISA